MRWIDPPGGRPWALLGLAGASLLLNIVLAARLATGPAPTLVPEAPVAELPADAAPSSGLVIETPVSAEPIAMETSSLPRGVHLVRASVSHSLARTFQTAAPDHDDVLSAIYARLFVWDLDVRRDLQKGDEVAVAYTWDGELADIEVATYRSQKLSRVLRAYRFHATGDAFPSWWDEAGSEVAGRLVDGPLGDYDQITSLLKDRPSHEGMDFKTPVGTPITSPRSGKVLRTDWNWKYNGNCVEVRFSDGVVAKFLHLSETSVTPGQHVAAGDRLGATGNTGRSTAPHLHYGLERGGRVLDPVDYHGTFYRTLPDSDRAAFEAEVARLDGLLASES